MLAVTGFMLTEYEARHRKQHLGRYVEGAPCILLKCLVLAAIAMVLSILGSASSDGDGSIRQEQLKAERPCQAHSPEQIRTQTSPRSLNTSTASRTQPFDAGKPQ